MHQCPRPLSMKSVRRLISKVTMHMISLTKLKTQIIICRIAEFKLIEILSRRLVLETMRKILSHKIN